MEGTEAELERFRREWREEVTKKTRKAKPIDESSSASKSESSRAEHIVSKDQRPGLPSTQQKVIHDEEVLPGGYHDLEEREVGRKIEDPNYGPTTANEPETALEHYEKAVEREGQGSLGDSLSLYRKAFRMDSNVDKKYKNKHFPPSAFKARPAESNTAQSVHNHLNSALPPTMADLISEFSELSIQGESAPIDLSPPPPCPIADLPEEILSQILVHAALTNTATLARVALVCKRLAFLVLTEDSIWKRLVHSPDFGFPAMHYKFACTMEGKPIDYASATVADLADLADLSGLSDLSASPLPSSARSLILPLTPTYPTYRQMFRLRPRLRFNGCYISTVNYTRPGAVATTSMTWNSPILIVTYYRYLRFFRDGTAISLLSTHEPADVVPHLLMEHVHRNHAGSLPQAVMKDALRGRWRMSGDLWKQLLERETAADDEEAQAQEEQEGDVIVETEGVTPKYLYKLHLGMASAGKGTRNNKLGWRGYWSWNRLTDDWAEFGLKNDRAFYWSRVRSWS